MFASINRKRVITLRRKGYGLREIQQRINEKGTLNSMRSLQPKIIPAVYQIIVV